MTRFAELAVTTNFSFLRGGSHPEELVHEAARLGLAGIAVTDRNTLPGVGPAGLPLELFRSRFDDVIRQGIAAPETPQRRSALAERTSSGTNARIWSPTSWSTG